MDSHAASEARSSVSAVSFMAPARGRLRAVVVDDTPHMLDFIASVVEIQGRAEVIATATNGIGAVRAAHRLLPDVVFLDVRMPMMNGFEAAALIKRRLPGTKVLLMSADDDPEFGLCALDCGADGFLWKGAFVQNCRAPLDRMFSNAR